MPGLLHRRRQLEKELLALGDEAMLIGEFDGFIAGLLVCPEMISPNEWLPIVCNADGHDRQPAFDSRDHANRVFGLIMEHYNDVVLTLMERPERYRPLFPVDPRNGEIVWELWIEGFAQALDMRPAAWRKLLDADSDTAAAMLGMLMLTDVVSGDPDIPPEDVDSLTNAAPSVIPGWVITLNTWRIANTRPGSILAQASRPSLASRGKADGDEPCPCGSGKSYRKCCGLN
jgi:uncharacterized protein